MHRSLLSGVMLWLVCIAAAAQVSQPQSLHVAPFLTEQPQAEAPAESALQNSVAMVLTLQRKSRVFPDLATSTGPLDSWQKFKLAANNSVSLSTFGAALVGSSYGQAVNRPAGYG